MDANNKLRNIQEKKTSPYKAFSSIYEKWELKYMSSIGKRIYGKNKVPVSFLEKSDNPVTYPSSIRAGIYASRTIIDLPEPGNIKIRSFDLRHALKVAEVYESIHR